MFNVNFYTFFWDPDNDDPLNFFLFFTIFSLLLHLLIPSLISYHSWHLCVVGSFSMIIITLSHTLLKGGFTTTSIVHAKSQADKINRKDPGGKFIKMFMWRWYSISLPRDVRCLMWATDIYLDIRSGSCSMVYWLDMKRKEMIHIFSIISVLQKRKQSQGKRKVFLEISILFCNLGIQLRSV